MSKILFKTIRWKNLLSTGNSWTTIDLNRNKSTLIIGENGTGKSTLLDAISFALYGKAFRKISKPQLLNTINQKNLKVEVEFDIGKDEWKVVRGIKPAVFEIYRNGQLINQDSSTRDYQAYLETNILKFNHKSFGQVVVLGSSTFVPFMQLPAAARREIVEDLLDIQIFSTMNTLLKTKMTELTSDLQETKYQIDLTKNGIAAAKKHSSDIQQIREEEKARIMVKVQDHINSIENSVKAESELFANIEAMKATIQDDAEVTEKRNIISKKIVFTESKLDDAIKELEFYKNHEHCPKCKQDMNEEFRVDIIRELDATIGECNRLLEIQEEELATIEARLAEITEVERKITHVRQKLSEIQLNQRIANKALKSLQEEYKNVSKKMRAGDDGTLDGLKRDLKVYQDKHANLVERREIMGVVALMLKDGGIKTRIVRQYVPIMNKLINKYLASMDFFVDFNLDENFNETIKSRYRDDFSYASFSEGEKLRIDLSLLFAWRAISRMRNSVSTNILIMDEIMDSSLDMSGTEEFLKILNDLTNDTNIFIISHKGDTVLDKFDHVIRFKKTKNFSVME